MGLRRQTSELGVQRRGTKRRFVILGCVLTLITLIPAIASGNAQAARSWYVALDGNDGANGSQNAPLRTIGAAVNRAASGDTVLIKSGTYNESVQVYNKALNIRSAPNNWAILDGAVPVGGFSASGGDWVASGWTTQFHRNTGPMVGDRREAAYPDQVFLGGVPLTQVLSRGAVTTGTFFHDTAADQLWIGTDPNGRLVEASNRSWGIYLNGADGSTVANLTLQRYATQGSDMAAIRAYANNVAVSGLIVDHNAYAGLSAIGNNITVSDSRFSNNGYLGVHGNELSGFSLTGSSVLLNNVERFDPLHSAGGVKLTSSDGVVIRDNDVFRNAGPGVWLDVFTSGATVDGNVVTKNDRSGIQLELVDGATVVNNTVVDNGEAGIWALESRNINIWHNAAVDNLHEISVLEGPRRDVNNVSVRNNLMGRGQAGRLSMLRVDDWTEQRSAVQMNVSANHNLFWRHDASVAQLSRWARWPQPLALNNSLPAVGHGANSTAVTGAAALPVAGAGSFDYRGTSAAPRGAALTPSVAAAMGRSAGARLAVGPTKPTPRLGFGVPSTQQTQALTVESPSANGYRHASRLGVVR